jgi:predicted MPP superfamily phosphohydrolase
VLRLFALVPLVHLYVGLRILPDLPWGTAGVVGGAMLLVAFTLAIPLAMLARRMPRRRADVLAWIGFIAMGAFSYLWVLTVLRDVILIAWEALAAASPAWAESGVLLSRLERFRSGSAAAIPIIAAAATLVGLYNARRRAAVREVAVPVARLPAALHGFTIAQISDVHVGPTIKHGYVERIVRAVNGLDADLIAITGDLVDGSVSHLAAEVAPLALLSARHGVFFVTGNHEYYSGVEGWVAHLRGMGFTVLQNQHAVLDHEGAQVVVAGVTDYSAVHFYPEHKSDPARAAAGAPGAAGLRLLLAHQPRSAFAARDAGFDVQLSGHTHGGQFLPWNWLVRLQQPFTAGLARLGDLWVYTSRGTGYWGPPLRLGAPSEITLLRLVGAT